MKRKYTKKQLKMLRLLIKKATEKSVAKRRKLKKHKIKNKICRASKCNEKGLHEIIHNKETSLYCKKHFDEIIEKRRTKSKGNRNISDKLSRYIIQDLLIKLTGSKKLLESAIIREEWVKIVFHKICREHLIDCEKEYYCGITKSKTAMSIEEDLYFEDLKTLISCKRSRSSTTKNLTEIGLDISLKMFKQTYGFTPKSYSVAILKTELFKRKNGTIAMTKHIADYNLDEALEVFKQDVIKAHKAGRLYLPKGIKYFVSFVDEIIQHLQPRYANVLNFDFINNIDKQLI